ncbi:COG1470 family protein [Streptomyces cadmiisoli]|uniref:COG1470 family protein n=1 Tax=Streptomyces cadmiisoli TaxID=2184053 RepID=UPI0036574528
MSYARRAPYRCASVLLCAGTALLGGAPAATAADGWSVAPAGGHRPAFYAEGPPGTALQDAVSVTNRAGHPVTVRLRGTGPPIAFADAEVRVPARTRADIPFTVTVPEGAPPGDHAGSVVVRDGDGRSRSVPLRLRAGGPTLSALTLEHVVVRGDRITYDLVNRGTTTLVPTLAVRADGLFGTVLDRGPRTLSAELPPGRRVRLHEPWPGRPALDAVDVRLTVTAAGGARDTVSASARFVPWGPLSGALTAAAGAAVVLRRRRRRVRRVPDTAGEHRSDQVELTGVAP